MHLLLILCKKDELVLNFFLSLPWNSIFDISILKLKSISDNLYIFIIFTIKNSKKNPKIHLKFYSYNNLGEQILN